MTQLERDLVEQSWRSFLSSLMGPSCNERWQRVLARWHYEGGCLLKACCDAFIYTGDEVYLSFVRRQLEHLITPSGVIATYRLADFNLDNVSVGKVLFAVWHVTGDERYRMAIEMLMEQMRTQPRGVEGGYWHKRIYPNQMWLDGAYMYAPFVCQFACERSAWEWFEVVSDQLSLLYRHACDPASGLPFHAWDESKTAGWSDPMTGRSPHVWGRAVGWFAMALVDVLEFFPKQHFDYETLVAVLKCLSEGVMKSRHKESGLWTQVLSEPLSHGNYLESSCSSMFVYALAKATRLGVLSADKCFVARDAYVALIGQLMSQDAAGAWHIHHCNAVAGLGGNPYRDGSFGYYVSEPVVSDDPKAVAAFVMASLEILQSGSLDRSKGVRA